MERTTHRFTLNKLKENAIRLPQKVFEHLKTNIIALDNYIPNLVAFLKRKYKHTNAMTLIHI